MQLTVTNEDLQAAPPAVLAWVAERLGMPQPVAQVDVASVPAIGSPVGVEDAKPAEVIATPLAVPESLPSMDEILRRASIIAGEKGPAVLQEINAKLGIPRMKECPPDRLAELLAELAVHE